MHFPSLSSSHSEHILCPNHNTAIILPFIHPMLCFPSHCFLSCFCLCSKMSVSERTSIELTMKWERAPKLQTFPKINNSLSITFNSEHNSQWNSPTHPYQHSANPPASTFFLCWFAQSSSNCSTNFSSNTQQPPSNRTTQAWTIYWGEGLKER